MNPIPASSMHSRDLLRVGMSSGTPSASSTSADPEPGRDRAVPVLRDGEPGSCDDESGRRRDVGGLRPVAAGSARVDETRRLRRTATALSRIVCASPAISSAVSPFMRSATRKAAISEAVDVAVDDLVQRSGRLVDSQIGPSEQLVECFAQRHGT